MAFLKNALMCTKRKKKVKLINHDCVPILMLLCIMLYIMLACLMLFAALFNAVCLHSAYFFAFDFCKCLFFMPYLVFLYIICLFIILFCIMHSAFNLSVFLFYAHIVLCVLGLCALRRNNTQITHYNDHYNIIISAIVSCLVFRLVDDKII